MSKRYVELKKENIIFKGDTEEEKKLNEMIYQLSLENDFLYEENEELKEQIKLFKKDLAKAEETCQKYNSKYYDIKLILNKFEKWLEEQIKQKQNSLQFWENREPREIIKLDKEIPILKECLNKLQELKGDNK